MPDVAYHRPFVFAHPRLPPVCGVHSHIVRLPCL